MSKDAPGWLIRLEKYMPGPESRYGKKPAGFWPGVVHGLIVPLTFIYMHYQPRVRLIEKKNTDSGYNFGYLLGVIVLLNVLVGAP